MPVKFVSIKFKKLVLVIKLTFSEREKQQNGSYIDRRFAAVQYSYCDANKALRQTQKLQTTCTQQLVYRQALYVCVHIGLSTSPFFLQLYNYKS